MPQLPDTAWFGSAPCWLAGIPSPAIARFDRAGKLPLCARWGVGPVWLIDPELRMLEAYENQAGRWVLLATLQDDDTVRQPPFDPVGFTLSASWADRGAAACRCGSTLTSAARPRRPRTAGRG